MEKSNTQSRVKNFPKVRKSTEQNNILKRVGPKRYLFMKMSKKLDVKNIDNESPLLMTTLIWMFDVNCYPHN